MKKKLIPLIIVLSMVVVSVFALAACDKNDCETPSVNYDFFNITDNVIIGLTELGHEQSIIVIPASVTSIGDRAFRAASLTTITFEQGSQLTSIGRDAFWDATNLTSITIPASVTSIGDGAFLNATSLTTVTFEQGSQLTSIEEAVFANARRLTGIIIPASVTSIGRRAFDCATNLTTVIFEEGSQLTSIGHSAFGGATSLTGITIPASVTSIGEGAFYSAASLTTITFEQGSQLTSIGHSAFDGATSLTGITIPASVSWIGSGAFRGTAAWNNTPNNSVVYVDGWAVGIRGTLLGDYSLRSGTRGIGSGVFNDARSLTGITIPASVAIIVTGAFAGATSLVSINVESDSAHFAIIEGVLYNASITCLIAAPSEITSVSIPASVTHIWAGAFSRATSLTSITIPSSVTSIGEIVFYGATSLTTVIFEEGSQLTSIGLGAFWNATSLTNISIPASVVSIGQWAFHNTAIWDNTKSNSVVYIDGWVIGLTGESFGYLVSYYRLRYDTRGIADGAFRSLGRDGVSIIIPVSVIFIGYGAFGVSWTIFVEGRASAPNGWSSDWLIGPFTTRVHWLG